MKKKQKIKSAKRLLCRIPMHRDKPGRTTGWNILPYYVRSLPYASAKFPMPLPPTTHHCSARFRPKLFCRHGEEKKILSIS
jgi:hypothetical protein